MQNAPQKLKVQAARPGSKPIPENWHGFMLRTLKTPPPRAESGGGLGCSQNVHVAAAKHERVLKHIQQMLKTIEGRTSVFWVKEDVSC